VDLRVLIIDDASTDHTEEVAKELVARDRRVEYRRHSINLGHIATYNEGLKWVSGDYHLLLSADDILVPEALARALNVLDAAPGVGLVYGKALKFQTYNTKPIPRTIQTDCSWEIIKGIDLIRESCSQGNNVVPTPTAIIRMNVFPEVGYYLSNLPHTADMAMWLKYAAHSDVGRLDADQAYYRIHEKNMHHDRFSELDRVRQLKEAFEVLFEGYQDRLPADWPNLRARALKEIALQALHCADLHFEEQYLDLSRASLRLAESCWPDVAREGLYRRAKVKLWLGPETTGFLRKLVGRRSATP